MAKDFEKPSMMTVRSAIPGKRPDGFVFAGKQDAGVDFVGNHPEIVFDGEGGEFVRAFRC